MINKKRNINNTFEMKKPKDNVYFKGRVWSADEKGKDIGNIPFPIIVGPKYIWFSNDYSIPLEWITKIYLIGSGFYLEWHNQLNNKNEFDYFCFRTFFGYNIKKRDEIIKSITDAKKKINISRNHHDKYNNNIPRICVKCQNKDAALYDFLRVFSVALTYSIRTKRIVLCKKHAKRTFLKYYFINYFFGIFGLMGLIGFGNRRNALMIFENKVITLRQLFIYKVLAFIPLFIIILLILIANF